MEFIHLPDRNDANVAGSIMTSHSDEKKMIAHGLPVPMGFSTAYSIQDKMDSIDERRK